MLWIGLTGGIATGKSTASRFLQSMGQVVIDADQLAREVVMPGTDGHREVVQHFGEESVLPNGDLNRKRIGEIVFNDRSKLSLLENLLHPRIRALAQSRREALQASGQKLAFYDVPLLFEKGMQPLFNRIVVIGCSPEIQLQRLMKREGFIESEAKKRIAAQLPIEEKMRKADIVIRNEGSLSDLEKDLQAMLESLV